MAAPAVLYINLQTLTLISFSSSSRSSRFYTDLNNLWQIAHNTIASTRLLCTVRNANRLIYQVNASGVECYPTEVATSE
ncbi:hypothetical protein CPB83DRAFT_165164 [Crepidotus variabilis]|uniref:Uncharacterized protein n=1 Tax=Crepidotus variabilis TaxID=179855 RepID=A0A9P6EKD9_9AGAR|nr:hypothetical protein CPB83DRAFT_165164 [Crepidotus variabilis]